MGPPSPRGLIVCSLLAEGLQSQGWTVRHTQQALGCSSLGTPVGTRVCVLPRTLCPPVPMHSGLAWRPQPHTVSTHCFPVTVDARNRVYLHAREQSTGTSLTPSGRSCPSSSPTGQLLGPMVSRTLLDTVVQGESRMDTPGPIMGARTVRSQGGARLVDCLVG